MLKVSVIIPTYNRKEVLKKAVQSVLDQTFGNFELIIVDDGSTDGTEENLRGFLENHKKLFYFKQENKGVSAARNLGISKSSGEYLSFLDSDNTYHSKFLEVMTGVLDENNEMVMAYSSQNLFLVSPDDERHLKVIARKVRSVEYNPIKLLRTNYIDVNAVLIRKSILDEIGFFDESLKSLEDWDLFVRMAIRHPFKIVQVDQVLGDYYYPENFDTITNKVLSKNAIRTYMGKPSTDESTQKILKNIERYLSESKN
ncbi:hypothetical protein A3D00_01095 [Candidatus Woesebacteria bacterium RIFCSPHIGHO2_02_FULL_38_9]|uniref:Glycosyltransferase 2-like domain-containing protein n=1 Tax=Candidatus Woesebacteria bacterium RIFCSPHIGHO2_01_FULL_39_28 TaxID=1802496 RepID=A0A1F7YH13_9BACT|nr:MAG: hypothetical protein A2627_01300 [Candidatus Woesebacteria bacterium RIFCSPHIGHO2_01_FULL_39_28]OGM31719.1 MAG: hypothetical protein A3D00_01095 [Candidatus Woesebacteria bacterium RIFCSPHIGHO2_02_FULL_38_9]OGM57660.1 MAG: hypothetical protein A3A50_01470 [Candidatus Woesebacteria bacterium RIFCSPLOWO2_01_FULL_38_20]